ncbi:MAG: caspase family protein, partial [Bacteroidales bacterium]|nr:caspase family protein [Bacteroidales bacterium]
LPDQFTPFAQKYVQNYINQWQQKGEFEPTADWQQRVNETTRQKQISLLTKEAEEIYCDLKCVLGQLTLDKYDADNEVYLVKSHLHGDLLVSVPRSEAPSFSTGWANFVQTPKCFVEKDKIALAEITFTAPNEKTYKYSNQASLNYTIAKIDYNFAAIDIVANNASQRGQQSISSVNLSIGLSDVAVNIPATSIKNDQTFALIIANENYRRESRVEFAKNDGETFKRYCVQTLGLPEQNVHFITDATLNDIKIELDWISGVANAFSGEANIIFYYAGHGIPDERTSASYLLPIDGAGSNVNSAYKLDDLYQTLGELPVKSVIVFMDACFSGAQRSGEMLASARGVAIRSRQGMPSGNMVVFSAAQGDETAYPYHEKGHGLFTYFLLKKLQETKGDVTLGELDDYISTNVRRQSILVNRKSQTPTVTSATALEQTWKETKIR